MEPDRSRLQILVSLIGAFIWDIRGDLLVVTGVAIIAWIVGTVDWRLGAALPAALLIGIGARL